MSDKEKTIEVLQAIVTGLSQILSVTESNPKYLQA